MVLGRKIRKGHYLRERVADPDTLRKQGYTRFRTIDEGDHKIIIAARGPESSHDTKIQAILHPPNELPKGIKQMERTK